MEVIEVAGKLLGLAVADVGDSASEEEDSRWGRVGSGASYEGGISDDDVAGGKRKRMSAEDRKARNRERNRLHARKTRQRKKQHVQELQLKIWGLRQERQRLLQLSAEHLTAGVLLALSCSPERCVQRSEGGDANAPRSPSSPTRPSPSGRDWNRELASHEETLRKITKEFESMDGGQQASEEICNGAKEDANNSWGGAGSKGARGGKGTLADRTALRRERNRMHAKRTRNRKKLFVEACSVMIDKMKVENAKLEDELRSLGIRLPEESWTSSGQEMVPEEPLPEYLAALWEFAEGNKSHSRKSRPVQASSRSARQPPPTKTPSEMATPPSTKLTPPSLEPTAPGQAVEDAGKLCAFMEAAQTRSAKRSRVGNDAVTSRVLSDHGSTTSESRASVESDEELAGEQEAADAALLLASGRAAGSSENSTYPAMWTSRQVHERYALPREVY